eukprot:403356629
MGKKKAMMIFKGSLKTHWIKYITNFNMTINPTQHNAINQSYEFLKMFSSLESKFLQPGFTFKHEMMKNQGYNDPSFLHVKFVNGYERKYDMANQPFSFIKTEINYINDLVEFERTMAGQDDELEDEI